MRHDKMNENGHRSMRDLRRWASAWTVGEAHVFADQANPDEEIARWGLLGMWEGLSVPDQAALRWADLDFEAGTAKLTATIAKRPVEVTETPWRSDSESFLEVKPEDQHRTHSITPEGLDVLARQREYVRAERADGNLGEERALFVFPRHRRMPKPFSSPGAMMYRWYRYFGHGQPSIAPRVPYTPLSGLRMTHAAILFHRGWTVQRVAKRLGMTVEVARELCRDL